ncbi:DNA glycosylase AlkZ-like family protein [Streptosporangium longisporum]|uniref:Crosslink repair DNA glycosylase YcaQ family protein n=1 Tax=Streptosporangium longisporum TaxID=46187 RepID=A0ABP6KGL4_9ACTN
MGNAITLDRARWLGFRWRGHGLDRRPREGTLDDLLLLGFQDGRQADARRALIQRTGTVGSVSVAEAVSPGGPLVSMWSVRGAPHAHRLADLDLLRDALAPRESDEGGAAWVRAVDEVAAALSAVVTGPTPKPEASREVNGRVPASLVNRCERCDADHVPDALFRAGGCRARLVVGPGDQRVTMLYPAPDAPRGERQERRDRDGDPRLTLLRAYLRVNGPASRALFRDWMGSGTAAVAGLWKDLGEDLVRVRVGDRPYDLPEALLDEVGRAPAPEGVVLVPPHDPYLRQADRNLLVPDADRRRQVWRALSGPGALLVDGEVAGTWRYRRQERELTVTLFESLAPARRAEAENSARLVAEATGDETPKVVWD